MALIKNSNPQSDIKNSGYYRLTGNEDIARLSQRIHSTVISNGNELERVIVSFVSYPVYKTEYTYISPKTGNKLKNPIKVEGTTPTIHRVLEKYEKGENCYFPNLRISRDDFKSIGVDLKSKKNIEIDAIIIYNGVIYIVEVKDGHDFDTKKSDGEIRMFKLIEKFLEHTNYKNIITLFNLDDGDNSNFKSEEVEDYITTGKEFCNLIALNFDFIVEYRKKDQKENEKFIIEEYRKIVQKYDEANN
jgi:hypothetical protein